MERLNKIFISFLASHIPNSRSGLFREKHIISSNIFMIVCSPQLGISPGSNLGGEVYDREILKGLDAIGVETLIILPFGKKHPHLKHAKMYSLPTPFVYPPWLF